MWTSDQTLASGPAPPKNLEPQWVRWTGSPTGMPAGDTSSSGPPQDHDIQKIEVKKHASMRRIATTPLQYEEPTSHCDPISNTSVEASNQTVKVFINQQGHTVKMARLVEPSQSCGHISKALSWKEQLKPVVNKIPHRSKSPNSGTAPAKPVVNSSGHHQLNRNTTKGRESKSNQMGKVEVNHSEHLNQNSVDTGCTDTPSLHNAAPSASKFSLQCFEGMNSTTECEVNDAAMQSKLECINPAVGEENSSQSKPGRKPSSMKKELDSGLSKIMADLAALKVLGTSNQNVEGGSRPDNKRSLPSEGNGITSEYKENDSPTKRSRSSLGEQGEENPNHNVRLSRPHSMSGLSSATLINARNLQHNNKHDSKKSSTSSLNSSYWKTEHENVNSEVCFVQEKRKSYDPEKARAYIRQQKHERMDRLRAERDQKKAEAEARKQKLQELSRTSLKLVQASIKRKSSQPPLPSVSERNTEEGKAVADEEEVVPHLNSGLEPKSNARKRFSKPEHCQSEHPNDLGSLIISPGPSIPSSADISNANLLKDISEMKAKIEAMAKSLQSTIGTNHRNANHASLRSSVTDPTSAKPFAVRRAPVPVELGEGMELKFGPVTSEVKPAQQKENGNLDLSDPVAVLKSSMDPSYLRNLTSNLQKMRESLRNVLIQSDVKSCSNGLVKPKRKMNNSHLKYGQLSSTDCLKSSDGFSDNFGRAAPADGQVRKSLQQQKTTASVPTLSLHPEEQATSKLEDMLFRISSDRNVSDTNLKHSHLSQKHDQSKPILGATSADVSINEFEDLDLSGGPLEVTHEDIPKWMEPLASKPYPVNFITTVKRKLNDTIRGDKVPGTEQQTSFATVIAPASRTESKRLMPSLSLQRNSNSRTDTPSGVTVRTVPDSTQSTVTWSTVNKNHLPADSAFPPLSAELLSGLTVESKYPLENQLLPPKGSVVEALNLEKMNSDFMNVLNSSRVDVMPAEKPLSAPSTPAKLPSKHRRSKSNAPTMQDALFSSHGGKTMQMEEIRVPHSSRGSVVGTDKDSKSGDTCDAESGGSSVASKMESNELVPPDVDLCTGRVERKRKPESKHSWISYKRGDQTEESGFDQNQFYQEAQNPSFRETFEIGHIFNPSALHLQFQAELNILDSFNESLCQVMEVEKMRAVAMARHQAVSEQLENKEDKAVDVQTSLCASHSEVSTINYLRGSGDPNDITVFSEAATKSMPKQEEANSHSPSIKDDGTLSAAASSVQPSSSQVEAANMSQQQDSFPVSEDLVESTNSAESKGRSLSDSVPEQISVHSSVVLTEENSLQKDNSKLESRSKVPLPHERHKKIISPSLKTDGIVSADLSVSSYSIDSTFTGGEGLIVESLTRSDQQMLPMLAPGENALDFTLEMLEHLMKEEELRLHHKSKLLKLRERVLGEMARAEISSLDLDKKKIREKGVEGYEDQITALRKRQRGVMLRFQQQREDIERTRRTEELAWQERRLMYLRQLHMVRMQSSARGMLQKCNKVGDGNPKKSRMVFRSIQDSRGGKTTHRSSATIIKDIQLEAPIGVTLTQSESISLGSLVSDGSLSSVVSSSSRRILGAGDSESSHLEEHLVQGLNELENRCRMIKEQEKALHERRQSVEQLIQLRRKLEDAERRFKDAEKPGHVRHRSSHSKHALKDRSTSPFQFLEGGVPTVSNGHSSSGGRSVSDLGRNVRNNGMSRTASITGDIDSSIVEEIPEHYSKQSTDSTLNASNPDQYTNESFESEISEQKTVDSQTGISEQSQVSVKEPMGTQLSSRNDSESDSKLPRTSEHSYKYPGVKVPLSPRLQRVQRRRYSSGSDDSVVLSQTETGSEQSDIEGRISALTEQLQQRKAEAERLRREAKRTHNERLLAKEQSLQKQLQAYETYIFQARQNLETELKQSSVPIVRPQIKQPSGKVASRRQDAAHISVSSSDRSSSHTSSHDTANKSLPKIEPELDFKDGGEAAIASEAPSEATSEVPSDVASEVSENSSIISNDAPSLVENKALEKEDLVLTPRVEGGTTDGTSDVVSEPGSDILSAITTEEGNNLTVDDIGAQESIHVKSKSGEEESVLGYMEKDDDVKDIPSDKSGNEELLSLCEQVKSVATEEDVEEISENIEEELDIGGESDRSSSVIKVFLREKDKDDKECTLSDKCETILQGDERTKHNDCLEEKSSGLVDQITNHIMEALVKECLRPQIRPPISTQKLSPDVDAVWDTLISESLHEATNDILNIYKQKSRLVVSLPTDTRSKDVRKRVNEILAETQSPSALRSEGRIREMMITTYGVSSPDESPCASPSLMSAVSAPIERLRPKSPSGEESDSTYNRMAETSAMNNGIVKGHDTQMGLVSDNVVDNEGFSQEWFDEDFGLTHSKKEAEELRKQQLQIEQEIKQLQQQKQAQVQDQIPYYYVREIPNKPPPPYTPPGQAPRLISSSSSRSPPAEEIRSVSSDRATVVKTIASAVDLLYFARSEGKDIADLEAPDSFLDAGFGLPQYPHLSEQEQAVQKKSARVYRVFLFDLAKQLTLSAYSCEQDDPSPPWVRPENWVRHCKALSVVPKNRDMLQEYVSRQVLVLFGFIPKASKENLTIRWSRKKRDHVDELLVRESQEEERQWTNYEQDEAVVKNNVTLAILDSLLDDTVQVLSDVFRRRLPRQQCTAC